MLSVVKAVDMVTCSLTPESDKIINIMTNRNKEKNLSTVSILARVVSIRWIKLALSLVRMLLAST